MQQRRGIATRPVEKPASPLSSQSEQEEPSHDEDTSSSPDSSSSSHSSSSEASDTSSHEDDSDSSCTDDETPYPEDSSLYHHTSSTVRRRHLTPNNSRERLDTPQDGANKGTGCERRTSRRPQRRRRPTNIFVECFEFYGEACPALCNRRTNLILLLSFLVWFAVQLHDVMKTTPQEVRMRAVREHSASVRNRLRRESTEEMIRLRKERQEESEKALGSAARGFLGGAAQQIDRWMKGKKKKTGTVEKLQPGCKPTSWQTLSFPTCNDVHGIDLREELGLRRKSQVDAGNHSSVISDSGYVGSGLWRNVWKLGGHGKHPIVLKMMKGEHDVDTRNLDRHRRDALVMERLTASPYIVNIYGFCGNSVLTEYLELGLDRVVYENDEDMDFETVASRETPLGRLQLALQVVRGVAALHEIPGGPIIHADIQAKQFLVNAEGVVKLNDFNRCRFMANSTSTGTPCPLRIPTAPGSSRSPEEYRSDELTEKIDVYSTAHVLYAILTGERHWGSFWSSHIKKLVKNGDKPPIDEKYLTLGTSDAALANLIDMAYDFDPESRPKASKLADELERLVSLHTSSYNGTNTR